MEARMSPALEAHFTDYAAFHGTPGNKACHYVGIPLMAVGVVLVGPLWILAKALGTA
jgi:uncharacterized membrane protein YGL010W